MYWEKLWELKWEGYKMAKQLDGNGMRLLAKLISSVIGDLGFCLITFELGEKRNNELMNYISNGQREDMIQALKELVETLENGTDFMTPDDN